MKYSKYFLFLVTIFLIFSCQKEEIRPDNTFVDNNTEVDIKSLLFDKDWILVSGNFYYENPRIYFNHPENSYLNPFGGPACEFDYFDVGITTWRFNTVQFFLNGNSQTDSPGFGGVHGQAIYVYVDNGFIITTRIIEIISITDSRLEVIVGEIGTLIGNPYSKLVFRSTPNIENTSPSVPFGYEYQGVLNVGGNNPNNELAGTTWVVTNFTIDGYPQPAVPNDTIVFSSNGTYSINNNTNDSRIYNISTIVGMTEINLNLYDFTTIGSSNYTIRVNPNFITDGTINNSQVTDILNLTNSGDKFIWMTKIQ